MLRCLLLRRWGGFGTDLRTPPSLLDLRSGGPDGAVEGGCSDISEPLESVSGPRNWRVEEIPSRWKERREGKKMSNL